MNANCVKGIGRITKVLSMQQIMLFSLSPFNRGLSFNCETETVFHFSFQFVQTDSAFRISTKTSCL